jgi:hypothetical protein
MRGDTAPMCRWARVSSKNLLRRMRGLICIWENRTMRIREARGRAPRVFAFCAAAAPANRTMSRKGRVITPPARGRTPSAIAAHRGAKAVTERTRLTHEQKVYLVKRLAAYDAPVIARAAR